MHNIVCLKLVSYPFFGLCNQLYSIAGTLTDAIKMNKNILIINDFQTDIETHETAPLSNVLDLYKTNLFLEKYNIKVLDTNYLDIKVNKITFGLNDKLVDVTDELLALCNSYFLKNNILHISKDINLCDLKGDPVPYVTKKLYLDYNICGYNFKAEYLEQNSHLLNHIHINLSYLVHDVVKTWDTTENIKLFNEILQNLQFHSKYRYRANKIVKSLYTKSNINVIHLRLERDAIVHWARLNNMGEGLFKKTLEEKYISMIKTYIDPHDITFILTYENSNNVTNYLQLNNYVFFYTQKQIKEGREINAIQDMCIGEYCNHVFIGPIVSSTFSNVLGLRIKKFSKKIGFDMANILEEETVVNNTNLDKLAIVK